MPPRRRVAGQGWHPSRIRSGWLPARRCGMPSGPSNAVGYVTALPAKARVLLVRGADEKASTIAAQAEDVARARRNRVGIAEAPEIEAAATGDAQRRDEATRIWRDIGNPFAEARAELALARASGGTAGRALRSSPKHATSNTASLPACPSAPG